MAKFNYDDIDDVTIDLTKARIKRGTDYSLTFKFGVLRIMCVAVFQEAIKEAFDKRGIEVTQYFTY